MSNFYKNPSDPVSWTLLSLMYKLNDIIPKTAINDKK